MALTIASTLVWIAIAYGVTGLAFALAFIGKGIARIDHAAEDAPWTFRLLIVPGAAALWPWMLARWVLATRNAHP